MSERDHGDTTAQLKALAPGLAEWPSWWRRNLTPGALYTIAAVILAAVVTVTTFVVTGHRDRDDVARLTHLAETNAATLSDIAGDLKVVKSQTGELMQWKEENFDMPAARLRNPYVRSRPALALPKPQERKPTP